MTTQIKPMLARDWIPSKVQLPCYHQVKIDGVRVLNINGKLVGRSLKPIENKFVYDLYSRPEFHGFDGEMFLAELGETHPDLCRLSSGALRRREGTPRVVWMLFDYITEETKNLAYVDRLHFLDKHLSSLYETMEDIMMQLEIDTIYTATISSMEEFEDLDNEVLELGYEGSMLKSITAVHKQGRSDSKMQSWRVKRFIEEEILVTLIEEGQSNQNEKTTNLLGKTERSSHKGNMIPNGLVGNIVGNLVKNVVDPNSQKVILAAGTEVVVSPGKMDHEQRKYYFENQDQIVGKYVKFKLFPKGLKDKPRFPVFVCIREEDEVNK